MTGGSLNDMRISCAVPAFLAKSYKSLSKTRTIGMDGRPGRGGSFGSCISDVTNGRVAGGSVVYVYTTKAGRIANNFCLYLDALPANTALPDPTTVELHVRAIGRAARAPQEAEDAGASVAEALNQLVARNLPQPRTAEEAVRDVPLQAVKPDAP